MTIDKLVAFIYDFPKLLYSHSKVKKDHVTQRIGKEETVTKERELKILLAIFLHD